MIEDFGSNETVALIVEVFCVTQDLTAKQRTVDADPVDGGGDGDIADVYVPGARKEEYLEMMVDVIDKKYIDGLQLKEAGSWIHPSLFEKVEA